MNINKLNLTLYLLFLILLSVDFLALFTSLELAIYIRSNFFSGALPPFNTSNLHEYYWIIVIILFMFMFEKIYFVRYDFWTDAKKVLKSLFYSALAVFTVMILAKLSFDYSRAFIFIFFMLATFLVPFFKRLAKRVLFSSDLFKIKVKVLAKGSQYDTLSDEIKNNCYFGYKNSDEAYDMVIVSSKFFRPDELQDIIKKHTKNTKDIYVVPYMDHLDFSHTSIVDYSNIRLSALHIENRLLNYKNIFVKYIFEKTVVLLISPFALFLHLFITIIIKIDSKGEAVFRQNRLGMGSVPFVCYKYRTMYVDNQEILDDYLKAHPEEIKHYEIYHKYKNDPRITKIGNFLRKTSLDEFPQFYNILKGNMNLIGPRPYMLKEEKKIGDDIDIILNVKPGITGLWQVSGRNKATFRERVELDLWYIRNWSLWLDVVIFFKTFKILISRNGAH